MFSILALGSYCLFKKTIEEKLTDIHEKIHDELYISIVIDSQTQHKCIKAIKKELLLYPQSKYIAIDGSDNPIYDIANGSYELKTKEDKIINVSVKDDKITLKIFKKDLPNVYDCILAVFGNGFERNMALKNIFSDKISKDLLKQFLNSLYQKHCKSSKNLCFYGFSDAKWTYGIFRDSSNIKNITPTKDMLLVLNDFELFYNYKYYYKSKGYPYRRGYLIEGPPKTGKTTLCTMIAHKYNRNIYTITLNDDSISDNSLKNLINTVQKNSIILIDEFEKQIISALKSNKNLTSGGILSSFDGAERLSEGTIIFLTANTTSCLDKQFRNALFREGRIDKHFLLKNKLE